MKSIYEIRQAGRDYCQTEGSEHYKTEDKAEPIDLIIALGYGEGFCMGSVIKYASRFKRTQNLKDLRKISDYAHILCGEKLGEVKEEPVPMNELKKSIMCFGKICVNSRMETPEDATSCQKKNYADIPSWTGFCSFQR